MGNALENPANNGFSGLLSEIPMGHYVMTTAHDDARTGSLVRWVQQCSVSPPLIMIAVLRGQAIDPLIRDSRAFALCRIAENDCFLKRCFAEPQCDGDDPFLAIPVRSGLTRSPIITRALSYYDCELTRHIDIDCDYEIFVGQVIDAGVLKQPPPTRPRSLHRDEEE